MIRGKKGKNGAKKYGRDKIKCERYSRENRRVKNKIVKIKRHLKIHINDDQSRLYLRKIAEK